MSGKIKVAGYSQRIFYDNNIEYRNFSDSLVGNGITNDSGNLLFNAGAFSVTINADPKTDKSFKTNKLSDFITLNDIDLNESNSVIIDNVTSLKLNLDKSKLSNYSYFGSSKEFIRVSLENIILSWPASLYTITKRNGVYYDTVEDYVYDKNSDTASFKVNVSLFDNKYNILYLKSSSITDKYTDTYSLRNLTVNYSDYSLSANTGEFNIIGFTGSTYIENDYAYFKVYGNPFTGANTNIAYHIKPNNVKVDEFFKGLSEFESHILNRKSVPLYTSNFSYTLKTDNGVVMDTEKSITWPTEDGYNIDFNTTKYTLFAVDLLSLAENSDNIQSDILSRFLVSESLTEFDTVSDDNEYDTDLKIDKVFKVYGRSFDEIKKYTDGLSLVNTVTYNKRDNTPDVLLKSLGRVLGWDIPTSLFSNNSTDAYITPNDSSYSGESVGMTKYEADVEMWRRLILNTPWIWKSKGTRKAIEFFLKFIGSPNGLIRFDEHVYVADDKVNMDEFIKILEIHSGNNDLTNIPVNSEGYPKTLPDTKDMYFQKAGLWYRQTGGADSDIDILYGNNPHVGPYDGGNEYINQFRCLIPNFSATTLIEENILTGSTNLFTNYNNGIIDGIASDIAEAVCSAPIVLEDTLNNAIEECFYDILSEYKCADGYILTPNYDACVLISEKPNNIPITEYTVLQGNSGVSNITSRFFVDISDKTYTYPIIHIPTSDNTDDLYDINGVILPISGTSTSGIWNGNRLNGCGTKGLPYTDYKGFSIYLNLTAEETYYLGLGSSGYSKVYIDGDLIVDFSEVDGVGIKESYYSDWHVIPYTFTSGEHYITAVGRNKTDSTGSFGFELYSASTYGDLITASTESNIIWSSADKIGSFYDINLGSTGILTDGYSYDTSKNIYRLLEYDDIYGEYMNQSDFDFTVDWNLLIYINGEEYYNSGTFFTGGNTDVPSYDLYYQTLQTSAGLLNLSIADNGDKIIFISTGESGCDPAPYYGKEIEIKLDLKVNMVNKANIVN